MCDLYAGKTHNSHVCTQRLSAEPAASLAYAARNRGATLIEINAEPTPLTPKADYFFQGKAGEILPELVKAVWGT